MIALLALLSLAQLADAGKLEEETEVPTPAPVIRSSVQPHVLLVDGRDLVIRGGRDVGFGPGMHVAITPRDPTARGRETVVELEQVDSDRSYAQLARGDWVEPWDNVALSELENTGSLTGPSLEPFHWRLEAELDPFLNLSTPSIQSVGLLARTVVAYYFQPVPLRLEVVASPVGVLVGGGGNPNPVELFSDLAFALNAFEIGVGGGIGFTQSGNEFFGCDLCSRPQDFGSSGSLTAVPLIAAALRVGPLDGFNLSSRGSFEFTGSGFNFNQLNVELDIPVAVRFTVLLDGEGGVWGGSLTTGVKIAFNGVGGPGTVFATFGGGLAVTDVVFESASSGPALLSRLELRL